MNNKDIGARIREARKAAGMTQEQLAEANDVSPQYIGQIERGEKLPRLELLLRITHVLGVSLAELMRSENPDAAVSALLGDCTLAERAVMLEMAQAVKKSLRKNYPAA